MIWFNENKDVHRLRKTRRSIELLCACHPGCTHAFLWYCQPLSNIISNVLAYFEQEIQHSLAVRKFISWNLGIWWYWLRLTLLLHGHNFNLQKWIQKRLEHIHQYFNTPWERRMQTHWLMCWANQAASVRDLCCEDLALFAHCYIRLATNMSRTWTVSTIQHKHIPNSNKYKTHSIFQSHSCTVVWWIRPCSFDSNTGRSYFHSGTPFSFNMNFEHGHPDQSHQSHQHLHLRWWK